MLLEQYAKEKKEKSTAENT